MDIFEVLIVLASLDEDNLSAGIFGQPRCNYAAGGPPTVKTSWLETEKKGNSGCRPSQGANGKLTHKQ
jgi:hypothetical protein